MLRRRYGAFRPAQLAIVAGCLAIGCRTEPAPSHFVPVAMASQLPSGQAESIRPRLVTYPNGAAFWADATSCRLARVQGTTKWERTVNACNGLLETAVAYDSTAYARTPSTVVAFGLDGQELWKLNIGAPEGAWALSTPAVTRDSLVVLALSPQIVAAFKDGKERWRFSLSSDDFLVAPPVGSPTEGILLLTHEGVKSLGADGTVRWSAAPAEAPGAAGVTAAGGAGK